MLRDYVAPWNIPVKAYKYQAIDINYEDGQAIVFDAVDR